MLDRRPRRRSSRERLARAEVLLSSWGAPALTSQRLAAAPRLRAVLHGADSVRDLVGPEVWQRGIRVTSAADTNAVPVAEYTLAAIIFAGCAARCGLDPFRRGRASA